MNPLILEKKQSDFSGLRILSFESRRAFEMESLIRRHQGDPVVTPSMREIPFEANREALEFARKVIDGKVDVLVLLTGVGTRFLVEVIERSFSRDEILKALSKTTLVARGPKPVSVLRELGIVPTLVAPSPNTWREVLMTLDQKHPVKDKKVFVQEYGIPNQDFIRGLKQRGAHVSRVPVYRWALPEDVSPLRKAILEVSDGRVDILLLTNATQIHHVLQVASEEGLEISFREALERVVVGSIGPVVSENLKEIGLPCDFEAEKSVMGLFVQEAALKCPDLLLAKRSSYEKKSKHVLVQSYPVRPYDVQASAESPFLKACRCEPVPYTPVWIMRQAGRYMKEYRDLRARVSFLELCKNSDLACEVTVTAQEKLGVDAAILFSDILLILEPMGVGLEYTKGEGPYIHRPVRTSEDVDNLLDSNPNESMFFVMEAIRKIRTALNSKVPLIGFAGAPFTVVSYLVEGKGSQNYLHTKALMFRDPDTWNRLMEKMTDATIRYVNAQVSAGVQAVQIFDSWIGCLSPSDYREYVFPHMKRLFSSLSVEVPAVHFGTGTQALLELMRDSGGTVIGLDWRVDLGDARSRLGNAPVQGNLDPLVLLSDLKTIRSKVKKVLDQNNGRPGHIFNLGHGVLPQTPFENVVALVDCVHELSQR